MALAVSGQILRLVDLVGVWMGAFICGEGCGLLLHSILVGERQPNVETKRWQQYR